MLAHKFPFWIRHKMAHLEPSYQAPPLPPAPKKVIEETAKTPNRFQQANMGHLASLSTPRVPPALVGKNKKALAIDPYYKEAVTGPRVNQKSYNESKILVFVASVASKEVAKPKKEVTMPKDEVRKQVIKPTQK